MKWDENNTSSLPKLKPVKGLEAFLVSKKGYVFSSVDDNWLVPYDTVMGKLVGLHSHKGGYINKGDYAPSELVKHNAKSRVGRRKRK